MYLRCKKKYRRNSYYLVESRRLNGEPRQRTVAYLGSLTDENIGKARAFEAARDARLLEPSHEEDLEPHFDVVGRFWAKALSKIARHGDHKKWDIVASLREYVPAAAPGSLDMFAAGISPNEMLLDAGS